MAKKTTRDRTVSIPLSAGGHVSGVFSTSAAGTPAAAVALAHGAGADMHVRLLAAVAPRLASAGLAVLRFNFPYKERGAKAPDRAPVLEATWLDVVRWLRPKAPRLVLGGKSMGGRYATIVASKGLACDGVVLLGYPLHPPGKPEKLRDAHLGGVAAPMLFLQGTRDPLCDLGLMRPVVARLGERATLHVVEGGDHDLTQPKAMKIPIEAADDAVARAILEFVARVAPAPR